MTRTRWVTLGVFSRLLVASGAAAWLACGGESISVKGGAGGGSGRAASGGTISSPTGGSSGGAIGGSTGGTTANGGSGGKSSSAQTVVPTPVVSNPLDASVDGDGIMRGHMVFAMELMAFEPCGTTTLIWANLQGWEKGQEVLPPLGPFCVPIDGGQAPCPGKYYVELTGAISSDGSYGHMGKFRRQLMVGAYLTASLTDPADCPFLPPVYPN